jgi:hypothetical protein
MTATLRSNLEAFNGMSEIKFDRIVEARGTWGSGERNVKIWIDFRKSPRFSLASPLSQEREKSSRPVFK